MAFDIEGARKAGYSDDEIADHLGAQRGLDVSAARKAGYTSREILAEVSDAWAKKPLPADVQPSTAGAGRGGQGGPTAEQAASARPGLANARRGGTRSEARPYVAPDAPGEVLSRPPAEPVPGQQPLIQQRGAPVNDEVLQATLQKLSTMTRDQRLAQEKRTDIPAWMRSTVAAANRRLEAADLGAERTGMTGPTIEARTARNMRDGADLPTARAAAVSRASAGVPTNGLQQATPGPGLLTGDEANANRAEGEKVQRQSIGARGMYAAQEGLIGGTAGVIAAGLRAIGDDETAKFYEKAGQGAAVRAQAAGELQRMQAAARDAGILPSGPLSGPADYADEMATGAANSVGQMIPGLVAGIATGNAAVGLGLMALPVFGQSYIAKRDDGGSPAAAAGYGGAMAALEIIGERYGLMPAALNAFRKQAATKTLEELPGFLERGIVAMEKRGLFSRPVSAALRVQVGEQVGEQITSAGQYLLDGTEFGLNQPISLGGFLANARDTAVQTLLATGAVQAAGAGAKSLLEQAGAGDPSRQVGRALAEDVQGAEFQRDAIDGYAARASDPRFYDPTFVDPRNTTKAAAAATPAAPRARPAPRPAEPAAAMPDERIEPTMPAAAPVDGAQAADNITGILQQADALPQDFTGLDEAPQQSSDQLAAAPVAESLAPGRTADGEGGVAPTQAGSEPDTQPIEGERINRNWSAFAPESGTLGIPREQMPQVKAEHRGALVQFLNARGITHEAGEVPAADLKPTQAEFSPRKVGQAREFTGGDRAILVSQDGHVLDGHHQWLAKREAGQPVRVIRLNAPINDLLRLTHQFPSSTTASGAKRLPAQPEAPADDNQRDMAVPAPVAAGAGADGGAVAGGSGGVVGSQPAADSGVQPAAKAPAPSGGTAVPAGDARQPDQALTPARTGDPLLDNPASWVIREKATGKVVMETFDRAKVDAINTERYEAVPIAQHLRDLNRKPDAAGQALKSGQRVTIDGAAWKVDKVGTASVTLTDAAGGKRVVATNSKTFQRIRQEPNEAARPQAQAAAGESAAPAAAPAAVAPVVPGARAGAVEAAGLTDQPPKRTEARGTARHPKTMAGSSVLAMVFDGKIIRDRFENLHVGANKFDGIAMNPPFGTAGRTAIDHLAKAAEHLRDFGRVVAIIPEGSATDKFDKWFYEEAKRPAKPIAKHPTLGPIYRGDTLTISGFGSGSTLVVNQVDGPASGPQYVRPAGASKDSGINMVAVDKIEPTGKRTETYRPAERLHMVAEVKLPAVTFERAGTAVRTRVVVIDKLPEGVQPQPSVRLDLSNAENITELFDRLEPLELPKRLMPEVAEAEDKPDPRKQQQAEKQQARTEGVAAAAEVGLPIVEHTTGKGKLLKGVIRRDLTLAQAKEVDAFTFKKDGGWFIRAEHMPAMMAKFPPANDTAFSRPNGPNRGVPMADAKAVVATIRQALPTAPPVHLLETLAQAPRALRDAIKSQGAEDLEAAYHQGEIYVFPRNIASIERMQFVVGHHEIRHHGIRMRLGTGDELGAAMHAMWAGNPALRQAAQAKIDAGLADTRALAVEEALADMPAADIAKFKGWPRLVAAIRQWLRQIAGKLRTAGMMTLADAIEPKTWTDADVARFVLRAEDVSRGDTQIMRAGGTVFGQDAAPVWRSALMDQVLASQMNAGPASAWLAAVKNWTTTGKVKADEVEWSGLADWLDVQQGKVTRQQVADYLQANAVQVTETVLSDEEAKRLPPGWRVELSEDPMGDDTGYAVLDENGEERGFGETPNEAIENAQDGDALGDTPAATKYANYTLPGGTNYREVLLTLPTERESQRAKLFAMQARLANLRAPRRMNTESEAAYEARIEQARALQAEIEPLAVAHRSAYEAGTSAEYRSGHWDQPNILAHIRVNDRTDADGNRVLFVEEIQSDWAQEGKKKGFAEPGNGWAAKKDENGRWDVYNDGEYQATVDAGSEDAAISMMLGQRTGIIRAPFVTATDKWVGLAMKRVIKMAVDGGYDKVAFVTGEQSADRYDLSRQVSAIRYGTNPGDGTYNIRAYGEDMSRIVLDEKRVSLSRIEDLVGKEIAKKIEAGEGDSRASIMRESGGDLERELAGVALKVGGEGMRAFYDRIVPAVAKDVLRKLGGGPLETVALDDSTPVATLSRTTGRYFITQEGPTFETREEANAWARDQVAKQPGFTITDTMRQRAASGMPVFARVWHGTPYRGIQQFDTEAIGTGEGNQAYGWGLYFASRREVADFYRRSLSGDGGRVFTKDGRTIESPADLAEAYFQPGRIVRGYSGADKVLQFQRTGDNWLVQVVGVKANGEPMSSERPRWHSTQPDAPTLRDVLEEDGWQASAAGQLYEVDIPDDGDMLLWDKPMAEQPERVRAALAPFLVEREAELRNLWRGFSDQAATEKELRYALNANGQAIYEQIGYSKGGDRAASEYLHSIGVRGIKYLDAMSRNGANGSFNYVVFSGDDATITGTVFSRPGRHDPATTETLTKAGIRQPVSMRQHMAAAAGRAMQVLRSRAELMAEARQGALDQFYGIQRAVQRDLGGLPLDQDPYIAARLANGGSSSVMRALLLHGQAKWADNGQHLVKIDGTKGLLDILAPLGEDVHDWFGWMIGNRAARLMREGRENNFTADDIKRLQALATPEKKAAFQKAAMEYASFKRSVLDVAQVAGLINPETRKTWDYADYIPFYRQVDAGTDGVSAPRMGRKGLAGQSSGIRVLRGGEAALNDPIENLLMNFSRLIDASLKNNAIAKTIDLLQEAGSEAVHKVGYDFTAAIVPADQMRKKLVEAGTPEQVLDAIPPEVFEGMAKLWALQAPSDPDVVRVMVGGKPQFYRVNDPLLLRSLTSFVPFDFPGLGLMRGAKRLLTSMVTATPEFLARNFIRDTVAAQAITRNGFSPTKSFAGVVKSWRETGAAEAMLFAGASFGSGQVNAGDPAGTGAELRRALRARGLNAAGIDGYMASLLDTPAKLWEKWRNVTDAVENANREAVYEATLKGGGSATAAAYESKDLMDFSLRGSWPAYQLLADVVPFLNARVQGLYRLGRADPKRLAAVGGLLMVATLLLAMVNDGEDWYEELPDWDKDTNWHFRIGGQHFRIPKPFEIGVVFATIPERIGRSIKGLDNGSKTASRLWANVRDQLAFDPVPQLIRPVLNVWANWDTFRQAPIETERDEGKLAAQRYDARTSDTARVLAGAAAPVVNSLELSPKRMEYLVTGYFGTVGAYALGLSDMVVRKLDGKPQGPSLRADDVPLVKAFYRVDPARSTVYESDLYLMRQEVEKVYRSVTALKKDDPAAAVELATKEQDKLALRSVIVNATKRLAALRRQADAIYADTKMTPQEKRQRLDAIQVQKNAIAKQAVTIPEAQAAF